MSNFLHGAMAAAHGLAFFAVVAGVILPVPPPTEAQQPSTTTTRMVKVGILTNAWSPWQPYTTGFRAGLEELGYVEGANIVFLPRAAQGDLTRMGELARELVQGWCSNTRSSSPSRGHAAPRLGRPDSVA